MSVVYLCIVVFLLCLAVFDLFVGVSNDAVNFLQSAIGARVAKFRTVLIVASAGVIIGAIMASGMMDVARHGIMTPSYYTFEEVMTIFLAVMVADVLILDIFNSLGMPTSTTVSLVFELLGGSFAIAAIKTLKSPDLTLGNLLNSDQALKTIGAIFASVAIAFLFGCIVMWIARVVFTFNYKKHLRYTVAIFGGIAFTTLAYFIFFKGLAKSPYLPDSLKDYVKENTQMLLLYTFVVSTIVMEIMHLLKIDIFKFTVLMGTFALAMAFAGNDLVNFIGVPLAGLSSYQDYSMNAHGAAPDSFLMTSLMESAKTPPFYLLLAGIIMIVAMATSKKAKNVIKTSVDLSRQDEGDEMFGSIGAARALVRYTRYCSDFIKQYTPKFIRRWTDSRFNKEEVILADDKAAFDMVRAAVNLVLSAMLITIGTNFTIPLSTTYVTFMVAMGSSLADRAWSRESAVYRVTGVLSVIGGWFLTAAVAFVTCGAISLLMFYGGIIVKVAFILLVIYMLIRSQKQFSKKKAAEDKEADNFRLMMRTRDAELVWEMLRKDAKRLQADVVTFALNEFNTIINSLAEEKVGTLRKAKKNLKDEQETLKKYRRRDMLALKRCPEEIAIERNTWFHLCMNSDQQFIYCLKRMLEPIKEHVDNNFNPLPKDYVAEFTPLSRKIDGLMKMSEDCIDTDNYDNYREILDEADACKDELSALRQKHLYRMQEQGSNDDMKINLIYLNVIQESQEFLSIMRHQLRATNKFLEKV